MGLGSTPERLCWLGAEVTGQVSCHLPETPDSKRLCGALQAAPTCHLPADGSPVLSSAELLEHSVLRVAVDSQASPANTYACVCLMMKIKTRAGYTRKSVSPPSHSLSPSLTLFIKSSESFLTESENQVSLGGGPTALPGHSRSCLLSTCRVGCCVRQVSPGCCAVASCFTQGQSKAPSDSEPWQTLRDRCSLPCFSEGSWGGRGLESFQLGDVGGCVQPSGRISSLASTP